MKVTYNGFTGELTKLERKFAIPFGQVVYDISIYDREKKATYSFTDVGMKDVRFSCGTVSFSE